MKVVEKKISVSELEEMSEKMFGNFVKAVVDVEKKSMVVDAEMHSDQEQMLLENGSRQEDVWGINLYPEKFGKDEFVEFDSMINFRPRQGNKTRSVEDASIRGKIIAIVKECVCR